LLLGGQVVQKRKSDSASTALEALVITPTQQHLGKLLQHEQKIFSFTLKNQGQEAVRIFKVEHSCGCTEAKVASKFLKPGKETLLTGTLNAQDRTGEFGSEILVTYQDTSLWNKNILQAKVLVGAKAVTLLKLPNHLDLSSTVLGQEPKSITFEITRGEAAVVWDTLNLTGENLKSKIKKVGESKWQVWITPPKNDAIGNGREILNFELLNSQTKVINKQSMILPWKTVSENFSIFPTGVYLSAGRPVRVRIKSLKDRPVTMAMLKIPQEAPLQIRQIHEDKQLILEVQMKDSFPVKGQAAHLNSDSWSGKIQLTLHDGFVKEEGCLSIINKEGI
jgi:hypothetical protein